MTEIRNIHEAILMKINYFYTEMNIFVKYRNKSIRRCLKIFKIFLSFEMKNKQKKFIKKLKRKKIKK